MQNHELHTGITEKHEIKIDKDINERNHDKET